MILKRMFAAIAVAATLAVAATAIPSSDASQDLGKKLFVEGTTPPCGVCHALADAGTAGSIGPSLDEMKPDAERVARMVRSGLGAMPPYPQLNEEELAALADYVARASGGPAASGPKK